MKHLLILNKLVIVLYLYIGLESSDQLSIGLLSFVPDECELVKLVQIDFGISANIGTKLFKTHKTGVHATT